MIRSGSASAMSLKDLISSPLEAGVSILDVHRLPPSVTQTLERASDRLARKALHITLVAVQRDYQLPSVVPSPLVPASPPVLASPVAALRKFVPRTLRLKTQGAVDTPASSISSPRSLWSVMSPSSPPMSPSTTISGSVTTGTESGTVGAAYPVSDCCGIRLIHPRGLHTWEERELQHALSRANRKSSIESRLSPSALPETYGLTDHLFHRSIVQNELLFSSEGLTVLSLDRMYNLKAALSSYSRTRSNLRLEDAVDELHRHILATNGRKVTMTDLIRSYDWLNVSTAAIVDLDSMYKRAYGGPGQVGGISGLAEGKIPKFLGTGAKRASSSRKSRASATPEAAPETKAAHPPTSTVVRAPVLKLQTNFDPPTVRVSSASSEDGDQTARPPDTPSRRIQQPWHIFSIDGILSPNILSPQQGSARIGPQTPNGYDDISPVTRGEWGFLLVDDAFQGRKTAAVETC